MVRVGLFVRLEAKRGKESDVEELLKSSLDVVQTEPATTAWFAIRFGSQSFGIFDVFPDESGRQAHLAGRVAATLMARASDLLAEAPAIAPIDTIASKLPRP
jgi:quinol monooxygenase YgiN